MHYQLSFGFTTYAAHGFLACRLMVGGTEQTAARSINGNGLLLRLPGAPAGTWIGELGAGSPEIKVQCRGETTSASITTT